MLDCYAKRAANSKQLIAVALVLCVLPAWCPWARCQVKPSVRQMWADVLNACAQSDLMTPDKYLFLGVSNAYEPGDVMQKTPNGYFLYWPLTDLLPSDAAGQYVTGQGGGATCSTASTYSWNASLGLPILNVFGVLDGNFTASLAEARSTKVSIDSWKYVSLKITRYEVFLDTLPTNKAAYRSDALRPDAFVIKQAIAVKGLTTNMDFSNNPSLAAQLKQRIPTGSKVKASNNGPELSVSWKSDNTLSLKTSSQFYIAAQLGQLVQGQSGGTQLESAAKLRSVKVDPTATVSAGKVP